MHTCFNAKLFRHALTKPYILLMIYTSMPKLLNMYTFAIHYIPIKIFTKRYHAEIDCDNAF